MITKIKETLQAAKAFRKIADLIKKEPNDFTLGTKIRDLFWKEKWNSKEK